MTEHRTEATDAVADPTTAAAPDEAGHAGAAAPGAAAFADAESREILNLLGDGAAGGSCCGGSCCA